MHHRTLLTAGEIQHGGNKETAGAHGDEHRRAVDALEEVRQAQQAEGADEGDQAAQDQQQGDGDGQPDRQIHHPRAQELTHSMISPRIRNLARAMEETKPSRAISSAASKYTMLEKRIPSSRMNSMAAIHRESSARMRSWAVGPSNRRMAQNTMAIITQSWAKPSARASSRVMIAPVRRCRSRAVPAVS